MPFSVTQFLDVFRQYNEAVWPAQIALVAIAVAAFAVALIKPALATTSLGLAALLWLWSAIAYLALFFATITPAGYLFAALFAIEAMIIVWHAFVTRRLAIATSAGFWRRALAVGVMAYALVGYPLIGFAAGQGYPAMPTFGAPCPTVLFTFGLLLWCERPVPTTVLVIPVVWSFVATSVALRFGIAEDYALIPIALTAALVMLTRPTVSRPAFRESSASPRPVHPVHHASPRARS